jgi:hypothetical protein
MTTEAQGKRTGRVPTYVQWVGDGYEYGIVEQSIDCRKEKLISKGKCRSFEVADRRRAALSQVRS